jgi:hypothetical protein
MDMNLEMQPAAQIKDLSPLGTECRREVLFCEVSRLLLTGAQFEITRRANCKKASD